MATTPRLRPERRPSNRARFRRIRQELGRGIAANANSLKASIGDKVWCDTNYNGIQDSGESGISGVTVKLLNSGGTVLATTTTNASGNYLFSNLNAGDYKVQVVKPTGYYYTKPNIGTNDSIDSDVDSTGKTALTNLTTGENDLTWDAGLYKKCSIGDRVWEDKDRDGIQDTGEGGIGSVKVSLQTPAGRPFDHYLTRPAITISPTWIRALIAWCSTDQNVYNNIAMSKWYWAGRDLKRQRCRCNQQATWQPQPTPR